MRLCRHCARSLSPKIDSNSPYVEKQHSKLAASTLCRWNFVGARLGVGVFDVLPEEDWCTPLERLDTHTEWGEGNGRAALAYSRLRAGSVDLLLLPRLPGLPRARHAGGEQA